MNEHTQQPDGSEHSQENQLLAENFDEYKEALEVLYVIANQSGRILFAKNWPETAAVILGEELIRFDTDGADDLERRAALEGEGDQHRVEMLGVLHNVEDRCVVEGVLQLEYVQGLVTGWGRDISLNVFSSSIVDRFIAPPPAPVAEVSAEEVEVETGELAPEHPAGPIQTDVPPSISTKPVTAGEVMQDEPAIQYDTEVAPTPPVEQSVTDVQSQPAVVPPVEMEKVDDAPSFEPKSSGKKTMTFMSSKARKEQKNAGENSSEN